MVNRHSVCSCVRYHKERRMEIHFGIAVLYWNEPVWKRIVKMVYLWSMMWSFLFVHRLKIAVEHRKRGEKYIGMRPHTLSRHNWKSILHEDNFYLPFLHDRCSRNTLEFFYPLVDPVCTMLDSRFSLPCHQRSTVLSYLKFSASLFSFFVYKFEK